MKISDWPEPRAPAAFYTEGWSRTVVSRRTSVAKRDQIAVSDRRTFGVYHNRYHNSGLRAQPLARKLLILQVRRDVRVVEGARLESVCRGNSTVGSNPTLSANLRSRLPICVSYGWQATRSFPP